MTKTVEMIIEEIERLKEWTEEMAKTKHEKPEMYFKGRLSGLNHLLQWINEKEEG